MNLTHQILAVLVLGIWAATLAQADARPRGGKNAADPAGHVGTHRPTGLAKPLRNAAPVAPVRNAIGAATQPPGVGLGTAPHSTGNAPAPGAVNPKTINAHVGMGVVTPTVPAGAGKIGSTTNPANAVRAVPSAMPTHTGGINGTGMTHFGSTPGTIGGPAKLATGITGTGMQKKK
jgi:hypothetical protein